MELLWLLAGSLLNAGLALVGFGYWQEKHLTNEQGVAREIRAEATATVFEQASVEASQNEEIQTLETEGRFTRVWAEAELAATQRDMRAAVQDVGVDLAALSVFLKEHVHPQYAIEGHSHGEGGLGHIHLYVFDREKPEPGPNGGKQGIYRCFDKACSSKFMHEVKPD